MALRSVIKEFVQIINKHDLLKSDNLVGCRT